MPKIVITQTGFNDRLSPDERQEIRVRDRADARIKLLADCNNTSTPEFTAEVMEQWDKLGHADIADGAYTWHFRYTTVRDVTPRWES